eukprot:6474508-Amphidinium_carterae.1
MHMTPEGNTESELVDLVRGEVKHLDEQRSVISEGDKESELVHLVKGEAKHLDEIRNLDNDVKDHSGLTLPCTRGQSSESSESCSCPLSWEDSDDLTVLCGSASLCVSDSTFVFLGHSLAFASEETGVHGRQGTRAVQEVEPPFDIHAWEDSDDLVHCCCPANRPSTRACRVKYVPPTLVSPVLPNVVTRLQNWQKRRKGRIPYSVRHVLAWKRHRARCREQERQCKAKCKANPPCVKGVSLDLQTDVVTARAHASGISIEQTEVENRCRPSTHVAGDGNCMWRTLWMASASFPSWKRMKKNMLCDPCLKRYRAWAVHGNLECLIEVAKKLSRAIVDGKQVKITPACVLEPPLCLNIHQGHAQPSVNTSAAQTRKCAREGGMPRGPVQSEQSTCRLGSGFENKRNLNLEGDLGAGARRLYSPERITNTRRRKRSRVALKLDNRPTEYLFLDDHLEQERAVWHVALHKGLNPYMMNGSRSEEGLVIQGKKTLLDARTKGVLNELFDCAPLSVTARAVSPPIEEVFMGHRATRGRGLLVATHRVPPATLARTAQVLTRLLQGMTFTTLGLLRHRHISRHIDPATAPLAVMVSWGGRDVCLKVTSPITQRMEPLWPGGQFVFFDPSRPHEVKASAPCQTLVAYTTTRGVDACHAIELRSYGFPLSASFGERCTNYTVTQDEEEEAPTEQGVSRSVHGVREFGGNDVVCPLRTQSLSDVTKPNVLTSGLEISPTLLFHEQSGDGLTSVQAADVDQPPPWVQEMLDGEDLDELDSGVAYDFDLDPAGGLRQGQEIGHGVSFKHVCVKCRVANRLIFLDDVHCVRENHLEFDSMDCGALDDAELSRLTQKIKDHQLGYSVRTMRALVTLDAKVRRVLRDDGRNKHKVQTAIEAGLARWHMGVTPSAPAASSWSEQDSTQTWEHESGSWEQVRRRRKKSTERKDQVRDPDKITLCPSAWSIPTRDQSDFKLDTAAVYQVQDKQKLQDMALRAIHADFAVVAVAPFRTTVGYAPPVQQALPFDVEANGTRTKAHINVWIHQLTSEIAQPVAAPQVITLDIEGTNSKTVVVSVDIDVHECDTDTIKDVLSKPTKAKQLVLSKLAKTMVPDLMDVFKVSQYSRRWLSALLRIRDSSVASFLQISGLNCVWVNTPREWMECTRLIWMREQADPTVPMQLPAVRDSLATLEDPLGIIAKSEGGKWSFAIRVRTSNYKASQVLLSVDTRDTYFVQNIPLSVTEDDLTVVLEKLGWAAVVVPGSRKVWRSRATMTVKAKLPARVSHFVIRVDHEQVQLRVVSRKSFARAKSLPPSMDKHKDKDKTRIEAPTWGRALQGKYTYAEEGDQHEAWVTTAQQDTGAGTGLNIDEVVDAPQEVPRRTTWWRGAQWTNESGRWVKVEETQENRHQQRRRSLSVTFDEQAEDDIMGEDESRKRNMDTDFLRATPKRRTDQGDSRQELNHARAMLEMMRSVMLQNGLTVPEHMDMAQDSDEDEREGDSDEEHRDNRDEDMDDDQQQGFGAGATCGDCYMTSMCVSFIMMCATGKNHAGGALRPDILGRGPYCPLTCAAKATNATLLGMVGVCWECWIAQTREQYKHSEHITGSVVYRHLSLERFVLLIAIAGSAGHRLVVHRCRADMTLEDADFSVPKEEEPVWNDEDDQESGHGGAVRDERTMRSDVSEQKSELHDREEQERELPDEEALEDDTSQCKVTQNVAKHKGEESQMEDQLVAQLAKLEVAEGAKQDGQQHPELGSQAVEVSDTEDVRVANEQGMPMQQDDRFMEDQRRADQLSGTLHLGLHLVKVIKKGVSVADVAKNIAVEVGAYRREVAKSRADLVSCLKTHEGKAWVALWHMCFGARHEYEEKIDKYMKENRGIIKGNPYDVKDTLVATLNKMGEVNSRLWEAWCTVRRNAPCAKPRQRDAWDALLRTVGLPDREFVKQLTEDEGKAAQAEGAAAPSNAVSGRIEGNGQKTVNEKKGEGP